MPCGPWVSFRKLKLTQGHVTVATYRPFSGRGMTGLVLKMLFLQVPFHKPTCIQVIGINQLENKKSQYQTYSLVPKLHDNTMNI